MCLVKEERLTPEYCFAYPYVAGKGKEGEKFD
jgi:hypothetical protein